MKAYQLSLFSNLQNIETTEMVLERKRYIQPFECVLASAELEGLLGADVTFEKAADDYVVIESDVDTTMLKRRLAYWQNLMGKEPQVPTQLLYEISDKTSLDYEALLSGHVNSTDLPKRRKLRYGPHDLHEYRGKFFPQLVKSLINAAGLEQGRLVLDPTCGSGTTNCEARSMGMKTIGLDLNPLSLLISRTKSAVLDLTPSELLSETEKIISHITLTATNSALNRWSEHDVRYLQRWFDEQALSELAQLLGIIDDCEHDGIVSLLQVCLSNIIRQVSWQKKADLRVRKEIYDYQAGMARQLFSEELTRQVGKLSRYLALLEKERPFPVAEIYEGDARKIDQLLPRAVGKCDLLITSPPYATALPYLDTDRLSLIILGLLPRSEHRAREYQMIGNREILESQRQQLWQVYQSRRAELPATVCDLIDELGAVNHQEGVGFRRRNLPALLSKYYLDMLDAMSSAHKMMRPNSFGFYVVGNNSTHVNGKKIEIPTDQFLWEIGQKAGWHQEKFLEMELLPSRDIFRKNRGSSESILVFRSTVRRTAIYGALNGKKNEVEDKAWDFHNEKTQPHLHSIHPYPARFIPQIPRKAILEYSKPGDCVLDPFCGSGTTLLESILLARTAVGVDNNAVACLVSQAKTACYTHEDVKSLNRFLNQLAFGQLTNSVNKWVPEYKNRNYWFSNEALSDLGQLKGAIARLPNPSRGLALATLSAIVVRVSYQDSDTRYTRVQKEYKQGSAFDWYQRKLSAAIKKLKQILEQPKAKASIHLADGRDLSFIDDSSIDLIVTSPPYLNAYDYHKYHRHRLHWIDGDVKFARDKEIGKHDTFTRPKANPERYFNNMEACFREWSRVLKPKAKVFIVIGDAIVGGQAVPVADRFIEILPELDLTLQKRWVRHLQTSKKSFNQRARINQEHILLFQKF
jgi:site-specific DNA-methyltransferase (cytosine-N4-specific)